MEQGSVFNIQRFSVHDGPGIRTTVFFKGCSLRCIWCHNPESISRQGVLEFNPDACIGCLACVSVCPTGAHRSDESHGHVLDRFKCVACFKCVDTCYAGALRSVGETVDEDYVMRQILSDKDYYDASSGGVTFSGGECMIQLDFLLALLKKCKEAGIHTAVDTAGNVPHSAFEAVLPYTDLFLYDVKAADSRLHRELTGAGNELILSNLRFLSDAGARIIVRIPFVPSRNGSEIPHIAEILRDFCIEKIELLPYHRLGLSKYESMGLDNLCRDEPIPSDEETEQALSILRSFGLNAHKS
ncbi:MAG: glycyl-radical enzyme activating protein [Clostridia bacterium]|nr:glycyl-radical enzyme activating protein [Clostridia bacterium]